MRVRQHLRSAIDIAGGHAMLFAQVQQVLAGKAAGPFHDQLVQFGLMLAARDMRGIARILAQFRPAHHRRHPLPDAVLVAADQDAAVAGRIDIGRRDLRQDRAGAFADMAGDRIFRHRRFHIGEHRLVDRRVDHLPLAGLVAVLQRHQCAEAGVGGGERVTDRKAGPAGRAIRLAHDIAHAAHRLADAAIAGAVRIGAGLAIAGHADHDQPLVDRAQRLVIQTPFFQRAGTEILEQEVGFLDQPLDDRLAFLFSQVQRDRLLVAADHRKPERDSLPPAAHCIAHLGRLDLDHLGPMVAHQLAAERSRDQLAHFDQPQSF